MTRGEVAIVRRSITEDRLEDAVPELRYPAMHDLVDPDQRQIGDRGLSLKVERRLKALAKPDKESLVSANPDRDNLLEQLALAST